MKAMSFLIATMPAPGHVHPALPVAAALARRGHEVLWQTRGEYQALIERTGAKFVPARHTPTFADLPATPDPGTTGLAAATSAMRHLFVERMAGQLADYEAVASGFEIDALLVDLCTLGAVAFHERNGTPWASLGISPLTLPGPDVPPFGTGRRPPRGGCGRLRNRIEHGLGRVMMGGLTKSYAAERARLGLRPLLSDESILDHLLSPRLHLQASTPAIEYPRRPWPTHVHLVGPLLPDVDPAATLPDWFDDVEQARLVVHVTQGTIVADPDALVRPTLEALEDLQGLVVATTPDPELLGPLPPNARVARFVPHGLLLPRVQVMVSNGGYNAVKMALAHGIPLVLAPWGNDQPDVAARVAWAGAGIDLRRSRPDGTAIRAAVRTVLLEPGYRAAAARIAAEFRTYRGGEQAADLLETLVLRRTPYSASAP